MSVASVVDWAHVQQQTLRLGRVPTYTTHSSTHVRANVRTSARVGPSSIPRGLTSPASVGTDVGSADMVHETATQATAHATTARLSHTHNVRLSRGVAASANR